MGRTSAQENIWIQKRERERRLGKFAKWRSAELVCLSFNKYY
jgi:hypothetical protein